ncbi:hypothetical protein [Roseobacter insulae]|nr:hypothetical protein [Roseobacter insulae]
MVFITLQTAPDILSNTALEKTRRHPRRSGQTPRPIHIHGTGR